MERTKTSSQKVFYPEQEEPIVLSKHLLDLLLKEKNYANLLALYSFYYYTAKWQKTNQPKATLNYVMNRLNWGIEKITSVKKELKELGLIEDVIGKDIINSRIVGHYIKVNFVWSEFHTRGFSIGGEIPYMEKPTPKCLNPNKLNSSSEKDNSYQEYIIPTMFDKFWKIYPRKDGKGKALSNWKKLCQKKGKDRPTWREIKIAMLKQIKTERWQDPIFIPLPATWLNQSRWIDDPEEMKNFIVREKETLSCPHKGITFGKDFSNKQMCRDCEDNDYKLYRRCELAHENL